MEIARFQGCLRRGLTLLLHARALSSPSIRPAHGTTGTTSRVIDTRRCGPTGGYPRRCRWFQITSWVAKVSGVRRWALVLVVGCSSDPDPSPRGITPDASVTASRIEPVACDARAKENAPCTRAGAVCESGGSPDPTCNTWFACATDFAYGFYWTEERRGACATCPADVTEGVPCAVDAQLCGRCSCASRRWQCVTLPPACPERRPMLGASCSAPLACDYGGCRWTNGTRMICESDVWQIEAARCD